MQHTATYCNTLQSVVESLCNESGTQVHCKTLRDTARHYNALQDTLQDTATHSNALQHSATHQESATHFNLLLSCCVMRVARRHTAIRCITLQDTARHCNTLQDTASHCNTLQSVVESLRNKSAAQAYCKTLLKILQPVVNTATH